MATVVYHNADIDGYVSGTLAKLYFIREGHHYAIINMIGWNYGDPIPHIPDGPIIMTDVTFPAEDMKRIGDRPYKAILVDHHKTAIEQHALQMYGDKWEAYTRIGDSATLILWQDLLNEPRNLVINYIDYYDVWKKDKDWNHVLAMQECLQLKIEDPSEDDHYFSNVEIILMEQTSQMLATGHKLLQAKQKLIHRNHSNAFNLVFEGLTFLAMNGSGGSTHLEEIVKPTHDAIMMFRFNGNQWSVSMYGVGKDIDLSRIALKYGGGGHANACGFRTDTISMVELLKP